MPKKLRVGTDCSGIEAPIEALKQLKIPYTHVFSSEILFGYDEEYPEGDITKRDIDDVPDIDLYVCGFPCQPFSHAGKRKGSKDKRGNVFWGCYDVITEVQPKYFILENVKGFLTSNKGKDWDVIEDTLDDFRDIGYQVEWKVLNTKNYGIPQNRERLYIFGTKGKKFNWPKVKKMKPLVDFVNWDLTKKRSLSDRDKNNIKKFSNDQIFVDLNFAYYNTYKDARIFSPCVASNSRLWCIPLERDSNYKELLKLQGFQKINNVVSIPCIKRQIGNSMSINVIKEIIKQLNL
jgi:DNA (cytosine-5)-methyltransferase 1